MKQRQDGPKDPRERLFCYLLAHLGNPVEAAERAGYPPEGAEAKAAELLGRPSVRALYDGYLEQERQQSVRELAIQGLKRLALGPVNNAVSLALADEEALPALQKLDLFQVSEIKRSKSGVFEIKFHDRLPALQALLQWSGEREEPGGGELLRALERGARSLEGDGGAL